jgi:hypothetical protein
MTQRAPTGLGDAGKRLWKSLTDGITYRPDELVTLEQAARMADTIASLEQDVRGQSATVIGSKGQDAVNPLLQELRLSRAFLVACLRQLDVPEEEGELTASKLGRRGARARWSNRGGRQHGAA